MQYDHHELSIIVVDEAEWLEWHLPLAHVLLYQLKLKLIYCNMLLLINPNTQSHWTNEDSRGTEICFPSL